MAAESDSISYWRGPILVTHIPHLVHKQTSLTNVPRLTGHMIILRK
jgi:hypothetical protein